MDREHLIDRRLEEMMPTTIPIKFRRSVVKRDTDRLLSCDVSELPDDEAVSMCERFGLQVDGSDEARRRIEQLQAEAR